MEIAIAQHLFFLTAVVKIPHSQSVLWQQAVIGHCDQNSSIVRIPHTEFLVPLLFCQHPPVKKGETF